MKEDNFNGIQTESNVQLNFLIQIIIIYWLLVSLYIYIWNNFIYYEYYISL
jgi:hypothetical protein